MRLFDIFRRPRGVVAEPGEVIEWHPRLRARVLGLFVETEPSGDLRLSGGGDERTVRREDLPVTLGRYEVRRVGDDLLVDLQPLPDAAFLVPPGATQIECSPITAWDFRGVALEAPATVKYGDSLRSESWHAQSVPQVVVAGYYQFGKQELMSLGDYPERAIQLVVDSERREVERGDIQSIWDRHRYEVVGINTSPAAHPPWDPGFSNQEGFVSTGGYFNMPLGLYIDAPVGGPYSMTVWAECGSFRSDELEIRIVE